MGGNMSLQIEEEYNSGLVTELESDIIDANLFSIIRNRRAVRSYLAKSVDDELIRSLIDFAVQAPSAMNLQPWSFVVIKNTNLLKEISDEAKHRLFSNPGFSENTENGMHFLTDPDFDIFYGTSTLIVICAKDMGNDYFHTESDCFLAGENLMLAAVGLGLATCPIGLATDVLCDPKMAQRLGIEKGFTPVLPIIVGYASTHIPEVGRNLPIVKWIV
jgi:nitroreductase